MKPNPHLSVSITARVASLLVAAAVLLTAGDAFAGRYGFYGLNDLEDELELQFSASPDRSNSESLDGAILTDGGEISVFLSPYSSSQAWVIRDVKFFVNGEPFKTEYRPPYDLGGTARGGSTPVDLSNFEAGQNDVVARVKMRNGKTFEVAAEFAVLPEVPTIYGLASSIDDFSILVEAVDAAGLKDTLDSPGTFTVFAPNNQAFADLLVALGITKEELLASGELLTSVLLYHVLGSVEFASDVLAVDELIPLQGEPIAVDGEAGKLNDSNIIGTDNLASNGVVHVIDAVLLPPSVSDPKPTIAEIAASDPSTFSTLLAAATEVGLDGLLSVNGPQLTLFAPTNEAFDELLAALDTTPEELLANRALLTTVLLYHLVNEELFAADVLAVEEIWPNSGEPISVNAAEGKLNDSKIILADQDASNGVVHVIDAVLVPPAALELLMAP